VMVQEFPRPMTLDRIGAQGLTMTIDATEAECAALAERMGLPAVYAVSCGFRLVRESRDKVLAHGHLRARVVRTCVISLEDFETEVEDRFDVRFVPSGEEDEDVDPDSVDEIPFEGNMIDLGEAAAEQLGLALDPYPRMPGVEMPEVEDDPEPHPFAVLRKLN
jgi:uncharacterized metal-binding protein YceD (DUF177 family)